MLSQAINPETATPLDVMGALNAVTFAAAHIQGALEALAMLPPRAQKDPLVQALQFQAYVREAALPDEPMVSASLHARITALAKWTAAHDPARQSDAEAVIAATARYPLSEVADGIGFEPSGFQEMILFIEELPW